MPFFEFRGDVADGNAHFHHKDGEMIDEVGDFEDGLLAAAAFARNDDFGALFAHFLRILSMPFSNR